MKKRNYNIDMLKALAIISVILIHSMTHDMLYSILAPYYIWQTVPVFMILMGYNLANSYKRKENESVSDILTQNHLRNKAIRILFPFIIVWSIQLLIQLVYFENTNIRQLIGSFFGGGYGPGSYFIPMVIQATLLTPVLYSLIKKSPTKMAVLLFFVSLLLDYGVHWVGISGSIYRFLIIRHIFGLTLGVWLAFNREKVRLKWLLPLALLSFVYITAVHYFDWSFVMERYWHSQHAPSYFWVLFIILVGFRCYDISKETVIERSLIKIGQASFHIYLTQMFYFWFLHDRLPYDQWFISILLSVIIPVTLGILFQQSERQVSDVLFNKRFKKAKA